MLEELILFILRLIKADVVMKFIAKQHWVYPFIRTICISILIEKWISKAMDAKDLEHDVVINLALHNADEIYQIIQNTHFDTPILQYVSPAGYQELTKTSLERAIAFLSFFKEMAQEWKFRNEHMVESRIVISELCSSLENKARRDHMARMARLANL